MASVSEVVLKYSARGASKAERADSQVRESVQETADTARQESGTVSRWMQRHKAAIVGIAAATTGAMAAVISASPTLSAQLAGVRLGFSLLAMTIGEDVAPATEGIAEKAIELADAYAELDPAIRKPISAFVALVSVTAIVAGVLAGLQTLIAGTFVASGLSILAAKITGVIAVFVAWLPSISAVIAALKAGAAAIAAVVSGVSAVTVGIVALIAVVIAFAAAYITNFKGTRDITNKFVSKALKWLKGLASDGAAYLKSLGSKGKEAVGGFVDRSLSRINKFKDRSLERLGQLVDGTVEYFKGLASDASTWGKDLIGGFGDGVKNAASSLASAFRNVASSAAEAFKNQFNDLIPSQINIPSRTINIPDVLGGGSQTIGGGSIDIPQLAEGGVVTRQTLAMVGEAGPEAVVPLDKLGSMLGGGSSSRGSGGSKTVVYDIDFSEGSIVVEGTGNADLDMSRVIRRLKDELDGEIGARGGY